MSWLELEINSDNLSNGVLNNWVTDINLMPYNWGSNDPIVHKILYDFLNSLILNNNSLWLFIDNGTISISCNSNESSRYFFICIAPPSPFIHKVIITFFFFCRW